MLLIISLFPITFVSLDRGWNEVRDKKNTVDKLAT